MNIKFLKQKKSSSIFMKFLILFFFTTIIFGQEKPMHFYNEFGEELSQKEFFETKDYGKNLDVYYETDSTQIGLLITRQKFGHLDNQTFNELKSYLSELTSKKIDSSQNIVINYLTVYPSQKNIKTKRSGWNVFHKDYIRKLHKITSINQFWINDPECDNLEYNHSDKINWFSDKDNIIKKLFFPHNVKYGNYLLIKPDGEFYYFLGEHSKYSIWENSEKFFN